MKVMKVAVKILTYPLLPDILPESRMCPVMTTYPLAPPLHTAWVPASHAANPYDASYPSVVLMMRHLYSWHSIAFQHIITAEPHGFSTATTLQVHPNHSWWPRWWWRRGFSNSFLGWWPLYYRENSDRYLCIHGLSIPHSLCLYPYPYMDYINSLYMTPGISVTFLSLKIWWPHPVIRMFLPWMRTLDTEAYGLWLGNVLLHLISSIMVKPPFNIAFINTSNDITIPYWILLGLPWTFQVTLP